MTKERGRLCSAHHALNRRNARTKAKSEREMTGADDSTTGSIAGDFERGLGFVLEDADDELGWSGEDSVEGRCFFPMAEMGGGAVIRRKMWMRK